MKPISTTDPFIDTLLAIITEITRQNEQLTQEIQESSLKNDIYAMTIQELRTPLSVIRTSAGIVERYHARISEEKRHEHLHIIDSQVEHIVSLLEKLTEHNNHNHFHANPA